MTATVAPRGRIAPTPTTSRALALALALVAVAPNIGGADEKIKIELGEADAMRKPAKRVSFSTLPLYAPCRPGPT